MGIRRLLGRLSSRLHKEESGWLIVEAMVGAVVLVVAGLAIYNGLDGASKTSGRNRNRTVASYLAQQDQERMRTMDAAALSSGYTNSRTVAIAGVNYTVKSAATGINDSTGSVSCTNNSNTARYLKITSTVLDPSNQNGAVVQDSLLSPKPDDGNSAVQIVDRTGTTGVASVPVTLQQSPGSTVNTDSQGCSLFTFLDNSVQYSVGFQVAGYVNVNGINNVIGPITVVPGNVSTTQFQYDKAGTITANFPSGDACVGLSVANTHLKLTPPVRNGSDFPQSNCTTSGGATSNTTPQTLFPFTDAYAVYGGVCTANDPTKYGQAATFAPILGAGGAVSMTVNEPNIIVNVNRRTSSFGTGSPFSGADVKFTSTDCPANTFSTVLTNASGSATMGLPYGAYSVCVDDNQTPSTNTRKATATFTNNASSGQTLSTLLIDASTNTTKGTC